MQDEAVRKHLNFMLHHLFKAHYLEMAATSLQELSTAQSILPSVRKMNEDKFLDLSMPPINSEMLVNLKDQAAKGMVE